MSIELPADFDPERIGRDGAIANFMADIEETARNASGFVLELGVGLGTGSTIAIQRGLMDNLDPLHISVDIRDVLVLRPQVAWWHFVLGDDREKSTLDAVKDILGIPVISDLDDPHASLRPTLPSIPSIPVVPTAKPLYKDAGLIFIDTHHDYPQMAAELKMWRHVAGPKTVWLFHDTHMHGEPNVEMVSAIQEFADANNWIYEDYKQETHGLGKMIWNTEK